MKIAILHEMLIKLGWAEKVVENWMKLFPNADIFTLIYDEKKVWKIFPKNKINKQVFKLKTQKVYNITKKQRFCIFHMSNSIEQLDFNWYDVVLCSSSWFAHWAITKPETKFIVYYHSPARYLWDWTNEYKNDLWINKWLKKIFFNFIMNKLFLRLRQWDYIASNRHDITLANSYNTKQRIKKYYRIDSEILYPPVETDRFSKIIKKIPKNLENNIPKEYYIIISALTEFKKIEIAIEWFNKLKDKKLIIVWVWNYEKYLKSIAWNNIIFLWARYSDDLVYLLQNSKWLIFPWEEDFWIVPIEAMSAWKPVFAYSKWWLLESVITWVTWDFFYDINWEDFLEKFEIFQKNISINLYKKENCIKQAKKFSNKVFEERIKKIVLGTGTDKKL